MGNTNLNHDYYRLDLPWQKGEIVALKRLSEEEFKAERQSLKLPPKKQEKKVQSTLRGIMRTLMITGLVFTMGFFTLNWQAYSQIFRSSLEKLAGKQFQAQLLATAKEQKETLLKINRNPEIQKTEIPLLNMQIIPPDRRIIISRINKNVPIVAIPMDNLLKKEWDGLEKDIQLALRDGVIHYPGTALPGEEGNVFITGHSSYYPWDPGRFKDVFALLHEVKIGDEIIIYYNQKKFVYKIDEIKVVKPKEVDVLSQPKDEYKLTLMTCTPVGTNINRLIVSGHLIDQK